MDPGEFWSELIRSGSATDSLTGPSPGATCIDSCICAFVHLCMHWCVRSTFVWESKSGSGSNSYSSQNKHDGCQHGNQSWRPWCIRCSCIKLLVIFGFRFSCHTASGDRRRAVWFCIQSTYLLAERGAIAASATLSLLTLTLQEWQQNLIKADCEGEGHRTRRALSADLLIAFFDLSEKLASSLLSNPEPWTAWQKLH